MIGLISRLVRRQRFRERLRINAVRTLLALSTVAGTRGELLPLRDVWERSLEGGVMQEPVMVAGKVLAADPVGGLLALADDSGAAILELQLLPDTWKQIEPGRVIELDFQPNRIVRHGHVIDCGGGHLIENDGRHPPAERRGSLFLRKGKHPFQIEWFNGFASSILQLGLDGPGFSRDSIPADWLSHDGVPGVACERFRVKGIASLAEIPARGTGDVRGVVSKIDGTPAEDLEDVALRLSGELEVPNDGVYTLHLHSDDGARLKMDGAPPGWKILPEKQSVSSPSWQLVEGNITYAAVDGEHLRLEVTTDQKQSEVVVLNPAGLDAWKLFGQRIRASGVAYDGGICVLAAAQVQFEAPGKVAVRQLTQASQVRQLRPQEAAESRPVVIQGVVTMATYRSMVLQDQSAGVYVLTESLLPEPLPEPGARWVVKGHTAAGDFSPIVVAERCRFQGSGALPLPRRPNWEEILNGSLDAELVEIDGILISLGAKQAELLTRDGTTVIQTDEFYPLPAELRRATSTSLLGARLKLRGVFGTSWNRQIGRLQPGVFILGNASMSVVGMPPADPADVPLVTVPDLWKFTSNSTALNRVRLRGRMMARNDDMLLVSDGIHALRLAGSSPQGTVPGDEVEVAGFARTGPISPVIVHPEVRLLAHGELPDARAVDASELPDLSLDGTSVSLDGRVISDTIQSGERRLELESGALRFLAVGPAESSAGTTFQRDSQVRVDGVYFATTSEPLAIGPGDFEIRLTGEQALHLMATPPWWTPGRLLLLVGVLLGGLALVIGWAAILQRMVRHRSSQLAVEIAKKEHAETERALEQERSRVARDLHDELGAGLTEIGLLGSLVANPAVADSTKSGYLGTLGDVSRSLVSALDEIVWAINPDYDSVDDLAAYLWLYSQRMLKPAGIACGPVKPVDIPSGHLGSRSRQSLLLAFKEALNNVIKHSHATRVDLDIRLERETVVVSITDNGTGIPATETPRPGSQGIAGMQERMRDLGGACEILAKPDGGTVVNLIVPLRTP